MVWIDIRARARVLVRIERLAAGKIPGMLNLLVKASQNCGSIMDQVIEFITKDKADPWSFCWLVVTSAPNPEI